MKSTRFTAFAAAVLVSASAFAADTFSIDRSHSNATFKIRHMMSNTTGNFGDFKGTVTVDREAAAKSAVEFTISTASINTGSEDRDKHLRSADFFDVAQYPEITFKSTKIEPTKTKDLYNVTGTFSFHGVTKQITLPVTFLGFAKDPWGNERAGFELQTTINRKDYNMTWNKALDQGGMLLSDDVKIDINLEVVKKK